MNSCEVTTDNGSIKELNIVQKLLGFAEAINGTSVADPVLSGCPCICCPPEPPTFLQITVVFPPPDNAPGAEGIDPDNEDTFAALGFTNDGFESVPPNFNIIPC